MQWRDRIFSLECVDCKLELVTDAIAEYYIIKGKTTVGSDIYISKNVENLVLVNMAVNSSWWSNLGYWHWPKRLGKLCEILELLDLSSYKVVTLVKPSDNRSIKIKA